MSKRDASWIQDIQQYIDRIPYGDVQFEVKRRNNHTVQIQTSSVETTRHKSNETALLEITKLLEALQSVEHDGSVTFTVNMKEGNIKEIGHYNIKQINYQG